ncbi:MAG: hypothetical protein AAGJ82_16200, partial [Bacteroidota bacterium]
GTAAIPPTGTTAAELETTAATPPPTEVDGAGAETTPPPADTEAAAAKTLEASTPTSAATTGCTCNQNRPIFRYSGTPKSIDKLGRLPEFGDSHGLTGTQFYEKLARRHRTNAVDRAYLDYVFQSMGYSGGFDAAKASQFSEVEIAAGTRGNLGFAANHGYGYYELNTSERDRQAFRIEAANGCHVHFMKTCGNYFFYCNQ